MSDTVLHLPVALRLDCLGASMEVRRHALAVGWSAKDAEETALLVAELTTNAVVHGGGGTCTVRVSPEHCELVVEDRGRGFSPAVLAHHRESECLGNEGPRPPRQLHESLGGGLASARRLATSLLLENRVEGGARVVARRQALRPQPLSWR